MEETDIQLKNESVAVCRITVAYSPQGMTEAHKRVRRHPGEMSTTDYFSNRVSPLALATNRDRILRGCRETRWVTAVPR